MADLFERIDNASDDQALEAVNLLAGDVLGATPDDEVRSSFAASFGFDEASLQAALERASPDEVASFARVVLVAYAAAGREDEVARALDATGQKALLLEIAVIGLLGLGLLHTLMTRGREETIVELAIAVSKEGTVTIKTTDTVRYYSLGESLAPFAEKLLGGITGALALGGSDKKKGKGDSPKSTPETKSN